jgi:membrane protease YdiL (CAAX protease family)
MADSLANPTRLDRIRSRRVMFEIVIVLTVTLGMSGWQSLLSLIRSLLATVPLASQTTTLVSSQAKNGWLDLAFQLSFVVTDIAWGCLALYLLWLAGVHMREIGLDARQVGRDLRTGVLLALGIGIPGLAFYFGARAAGINLNVAPTSLTDHWWTIPVLILAAFGNGFVEETIVVGYLITRLRDARWSMPAAIIASCLLRGSYHLYQGFGGFIGNVVLGFVFVVVWRRTGRLWPLIIAHTLIDVAAFVGYGLLAPHLSWL